MALQPLAASKLRLQVTVARHGAVMHLGACVWRR